MSLTSCSFIHSHIIFVVRSRQWIETQCEISCFWCPQCVSYVRGWSSILSNAFLVITACFHFPETRMFSISCLSSVRAITQHRHLWGVYFMLLRFFIRCWVYVTDSYFPAHTSFRGQWDCVRLWSVVISQSEIRTGFSTRVCKNHTSID